MGINNIGRLWIWDFRRKEGVLPLLGIEIRISHRSEESRGGVIHIKDISSTWVSTLSHFGPGGVFLSFPKARQVITTKMKSLMIMVDCDNLHIFFTWKNYYRYWRRNKG